MSNETRLILIGFVAPFFLSAAIVATLYVCQVWKIEKPYPMPLWVVPGEVAGLAIIVGALWLWNR